MFRVTNRRNPDLRLSGKHDPGLASCSYATWRDATPLTSNYMSTIWEQVPWTSTATIHPRASTAQCKRGVAAYGLVSISVWQRDCNRDKLGAKRYCKLYFISKGNVAIQ